MSKKDDMMNRFDGDKDGLIYECKHPTTSPGVWHCATNVDNCTGEDGSKPCPRLGTIKRGVLDEYWDNILKNWEPRAY